jgi:hypothetical protein
MLWKTTKTPRLRLPSPLPHKTAILEISMSNTSQWSGAAGKKPEGAARIGKDPSETSMTDLSDQVSGAVREGAREAKEQASNVAESAKGLASQAGEKLLSSVEEQKAAWPAPSVGRPLSSIRTCLRLPSTSASRPIRSVPYRMLSAGEISTSWLRIFRGLRAGSRPPFLAQLSLLDSPRCVF